MLYSVGVVCFMIGYLRKKVKVLSNRNISLGGVSNAEEHFYFFMGRVRKGIWDMFPSPPPFFFPPGKSQLSKDFLLKVRSNVKNMII